MRRILLFALAAACAVSPSLLHAAPTAVRPKAVIILADDLGVNDLSLYGSNFFEPLHIDALARHGMKFTRAYPAKRLSKRHGSHDRTLT
jgi:hypothetical protein